ncbi:MAG TPA: hypothetical protein VGS12_14940 [Caulobacteraceae bacterium]|nr:hypothetical protein [Caulobacteraceae bacterium]
MVGNGMRDATVTAPSGESVIPISKGRVREALDRAQDVYGRAAERAKDAGRQADRLINEQTYPALGVAAVVGLVLGLAIGLVMGARD